MTSLGLALLLLSMAQESADAVRTLIRRLGSEKIEERNEAAASLKKLGPAALSELEKAGSDTDPEVNSRVRRLVRVIQIAQQLTPRLRSTLPGVEERLADGDPLTWSQVFFEAVSLRDGKPAYPDLQPDDLGPLVVKAFRGTERPEQQGELCRMAARLKLRAAVPELLRLLKVDESYAVQEDNVFSIYFVSGEASTALCDLKADEAVPELIAFLRDPKVGTRLIAVQTLGRMKAVKALPHLLPLLRDSDTTVRRDTVDALGELDARSAEADLRKLLNDDAMVRVAVAATLVKFGREDGVTELLTLLKDSEVGTRSSALWALWKLKRRDAAPQVLPLLEDVNPNIRIHAVEFFADLGIKESIPSLRKLLQDSHSGVRDEAERALKTLGEPGK